MMHPNKQLFTIKRISKKTTIRLLLFFFWQTNVHIVTNVFSFTIYKENMYKMCILVLQQALFDCCKYKNRVPQISILLTC